MILGSRTWIFPVQEYMELKRGRLLGHGSCPCKTCAIKDAYNPNAKLVTTEYKLPELMEGNWKLKDNGEEMDNGFAILKINKDECFVRYYEIPSMKAGSWGMPECTFTENF